MKKFVAFSLVTLLVLSGCGNQPAVPADTLPAPSQAANSTIESPNESPNMLFFPKDTITEKAPEIPIGESLTTPENKPTEAEIVPEPQTEASIVTPQDSQYESEIAPPATDMKESPMPPVQEEAPPQKQPEPSKPQSEPEPTITQPTPPEVPSEPEQQGPTESVDDCIAYGKDYAISIGLALDNTAVDCWDTPITSSDPYYIKRDLISRLNRYKEHENVTDVWIWKESVGNGRYEVYIGYA